MEEESNGELALETLLKQNNGKISVLLYCRPTHTDQYLHYSSQHQTSCEESIVSSFFSKAYSIITNKHHLNKENARINQVIKENEIRETLVKSLRALPPITACTSHNNKHSLEKEREIVIL